MKFESKKREDIEMDELNIRSHLSTSLEAEGISISEDLINRTMDAIRLHETNCIDISKDNTEHRKLLFFRNTRALVTVAAAVLILVIGINALGRLSPLRTKNDKSNYREFTSVEDAGRTEIYTARSSIEEGKEENYDRDKSDDFKADAPMLEDMTGEPTDDLAKEDGTSLDMEISKSENRVEEKAEEPGENDMVMSIQGATLAFTDVIVINSSEVSSITIGSTATGEERTISNRDQIDSFYSVMGEHLFMQSATEDTTNLYVVSFTAENGDSQLLIGETNVVVDNTLNDTVSHGLYSAADHSRLLEDIKKLLAD